MWGLWLVNLLDVHDVWETHVPAQQTKLEWCQVCIFVSQWKVLRVVKGDYLDVLGKGWENGEKKKKDDIRRELESWKPATEAAMERHACFIARLNAQDVHEESATISGST